MSGSDYRTPGVYVTEFPHFPPSIVPVPTAIPAFVGYTEKDLTGGIPTRITSLPEYELHFGKATAQAEIELKVTDSTTSPIQIEFPTAGKKPGLQSFLYYSIQMFFLNGGNDCYIVSVGQDTVQADKVVLKSGLDKLAAIDEPTLIVIPDTSILSDDVLAINLMNDMLDQCALLENRFAILDVRTSPEVFRNLITSDADKAKYGAAYYPDLVSVLNYTFSDDSVSVLTSGGKTLTELNTADNNLYNQIRTALNALYITLPPSGALAGIYAAVDTNRGVWKAPANISIAGVQGPSVEISDQEDEYLNVDPIAGKSINAIRSFAGNGTLVWGARTLAGNDNEWRYVPVRRLFIMVEQSCKNAVAFFIFEPNDANTWTKVQSMTENFMNLLWKGGALQGAKPSEAYYTRIGLGQTMTAQDILDGKLILEIGMAPVRPAEFIIIRIDQFLRNPI